MQIMSFTCLLKPLCAALGCLEPPEKSITEFVKSPCSVVLMLCVQYFFFFGFQGSFR